MPKRLIYLLLFLSLGGYTLSGYFMERSHFSFLISVYSGLFLIYFFLLRYRYSLNLKLGIIAGLIFRFMLIFSLPVLSDDFYRFLWDGHIQQLGFNPFDYTPRQLLAQNQDSYLEQLFPYLNSPDYFSVYPQLLQWIFRLCSYVADDQILRSVIILKSILFAFEGGSIYLLQKLLRLKNINPKLIFFYTLNPLVIIELTGNIHFEALMIFFILLTAWFIEKQNGLSSAGALTMAIQAKLIPLIALPLLFKKNSPWKNISYVLLCPLLFWIFNPWMWTSPEKVLNFFSSLKLYYGKFEFNGGFYSIFRAAGWWLLGYNPIAWVSKIMLALSLAAFLFIY
ncbi:MAG TPA: polyprenol phosphomannose-dependent alpha 1,6 mannosyltransferase MptB [Daejeonella sp.]|nr:polyprenol phosphomannose-dependent alpha 1,6 mannosyltransferase MptB [Daejeonella sp.]